MKVILLQDVAKIGHRFEVATVPDGYALNKLIPQKMAQPATPENLKRVQAQAAKAQEGREHDVAEFTAAIEALKDTQVTVTVEANEEGKMFQALKAQTIIDAVAQEANVTLHEQHIIIATPIKSVGEHTVDLALGDQRGTVSLNVVAK